MVMYALIWNKYPEARLAIAFTKEELEDTIVTRKNIWQECVGRDITDELIIKKFIVDKE